jgi:activator of HSP90 ATPase
MVLHNPNNWHWVNKDAFGWAKEYLEEKLTGISAEEGGVTAKVIKLVNMDGDVDVSQRKGKVITLFDVKLQLDYEGVHPPSKGVCSYDVAVLELSLGFRR